MSNEQLSMNELDIDKEKSI